MMFPLPAVQVTVIPRLTWIYHKRVEPAGQGFCRLNRAAVLIQEDTRIIFSNRFQEINEVAAFVQKLGFREFAEELIHTADIQTDVTKVFGQIKCVLAVYRDRCFYMTAAFCATDALEADLGRRCHTNGIPQFILHDLLPPCVRESSEAMRWCLSAPCCGHSIQLESSAFLLHRKGGRSPG